MLQPITMKRETIKITNTEPSSYVTETLLHSDDNFDFMFGKHETNWTPNTKPSSCVTETQANSNDNEIDFIFGKHKAYSIEAMQRLSIMSIMAREYKKMAIQSSKKRFEKSVFLKNQRSF